MICEGPPTVADAAAPAQQSRADVPDVDEEENGQLCDVDVKRYFYLKNTETRDLVLDVEGMSTHRGTPVILWDQKFSTHHQPQQLLNQLWYEHSATSTIRTALNDFCLDIHGQ